MLKHCIQEAMPIAVIIIFYINNLYAKILIRDKVFIRDKGLLRIKYELLNTLKKA